MATNDPILGQETLSKLNIFSKKPIVEPGIALVYYKRNGDLLPIKEGGQITSGEITWGNIVGFYKVDIAPHTYKIQQDLPCDSDAYNFSSEIEITYQIEEPDSIIRNQVHDIPGVLNPEIIETLRGISRKYSPQQSKNVEQEINQYFKSGNKLNGIAIKRVVARLKLEGESRDHLRTLQEIENEKERSLAFHDLEKLRTEHEFEIKQMRWNFYAPFIRKGEWQLLALQLAQNPDDVATITAMLAQQNQNEFDKQISLLKVMLEEDALEEFQVEEVGKRLLQNLVSSLPAKHTKALGSGTQKKKSKNKSDQPPQVDEEENDIDDTEEV